MTQSAVDARGLDALFAPRSVARPRGRPPVDEAALVPVLEGLGSLLVQQPRILEIDVNPVIAAGRHAVAVDAGVMVGERA